MCCLYDLTFMKLKTAWQVRIRLRFVMVDIRFTKRKTHILFTRGTEIILDSGELN